jgi:hypothetical protein
MPSIRSNGYGIPIIALDIDGSMGDWHAHFLKFAEDWFGKPMPPADQINPGMRLHKFMGVPLARYRECKLAFRQGGLKRSMPIYPGASELTKDVRKAGAEVWICTTRPYLRLDNIDPDTQENLQRNRIQYDGLIYGDDKYRELFRQVPGRVAAIVDDLPEMIMEAFRWGVRDPYLPSVYLRDQPYNRHFHEAQRFSDFGVLREKLLQDILKWKRAQRD